ncbi:hypothetical protein MBLNU13_g01391t1 [Cladosporium sp. NU13]
MRSSHILVLAWALTCSAATLPACGTSCVARAIKKTGCAANDSPCICNSEHYAGYLQYCFSKKCSAGDDADALESATKICHLVSHDDHSSKLSPADELKKRDAQGWNGNGANKGGNPWGPSNHPSNSPPKPSSNKPPPGKPPGKSNWPPAPKPTPSPPKPSRGGPNPPPTTESKHTQPWPGHTTKTKPTTTKPWHQTTPPHTTKTHTWYTPTQNPTVLAGIIPGLVPGIVPDIIDGILGNL